MPKIEQWIVDRVLAAANIVDVVSDFVRLRKQGVNYTGICPFHDDKNDGNFIVRPKTVSKYPNTWHCFVCEKGGGVVQFLQTAANMTFPEAIRYLGKKYCIEVDDVPVDYTPPPPKPLPPPPPPMVMERSWVRETMNRATDQNLFCYWMQYLPWSDEQRVRLKGTLWQYCVGGHTDGRVVWWNIDHTGVPRSAKMMRYKPDGHRDKDEKPGWLYNYDGYRQTCKPDEHTILKPLFGSHLLKRYPQATVNIVESEKTAVIMANYYGNLDKQLWLACGGIEYLKNLEPLQPLIDQGRTVWLWPDKDGQERWQEVAEKLGSEKVRVYTRFFETCWKPEDGDKADAADITIRMMRTGEGPRQAKADVAEEQRHTAAEQDNGEPFLDVDERSDPRLHMWRMKMGQVKSSGWGKWPTSKVEGVKSVGEILSEIPIIRKLI